MKEAIHLEGGDVKDSVKSVAEAITTIFEAGDTYRMEQSTVVKALEILERAGGVSNVNVANNVFTSNDKYID